jgi:hypothetical protein
VEDLATAVTAAAGQPVTSRVGTVLAVNPIQVDMGGTILDAAVVGCASSYLPRTGDTVVLIGQAVEGGDTSGSTWMITAACVNSGSGAFSHNGIQAMAQVQSEGAGVFTNMTGITFPFTKRRAGSLIHGRIAGASFSSVAAAGGEFAARVTVTATGVQVALKVLGSMFYNAALTHGGWAGFDDIPNIAAGSYTVQAQFRKYIGGVGNIQTDQNDRISLFFDEV